MRKVALGVVFALSIAACGNQAQPTAAPVETSAPTAAPVAVLAIPAPTPSPSPSASATPNASPVATPTAKPVVTPPPTPAPTPLCLASGLAAKVTGWEGAAGHRIASVTLTNESSGKCTVQGTPEVELLGAHGRILMDSQTNGPDGLPHVAPGAPVLTLRKGASLRTLVDADNYCGTAPALPTTVAFVLPEEAGRIVAAPGPGGGVPPCLGSGSLGSIAMNGWVK